jgi:K+-transporting ATPase ATPase C chain
MLVICCVIYFALITLIARLAPGGGKGETLSAGGRVVGYALIGQKFTQDKYFWGRPSAVEYNAAGSGGSNKAGSNPDYIKTVQNRIDTFLVHNPGVLPSQIPAEMVTASGSGLDPDISPASADVQVARIAAVRKLSKASVASLVQQHTVKGIFGPDIINVLKLNIALDKQQ